MRKWDNLGRVKFEYVPGTHLSMQHGPETLLDRPSWVPNWTCWSTRDPALLPTWLDKETPGY